MTDGRFQPTPESVGPEEVQAPSMHQQYAKWISETLASEFGPDGKPQDVLMLNGEVVLYDKIDYGSFEELVSPAYYEAVPDEEQVEFKGAVVDVLSQRLSDPNPNLDEIKILVMLVDDIMIPEASTILSDALINNETVKSDPDISSEMYETVFWLVEQRHVEEYRDVAYAATQNLINHPDFDERRLLGAIEALISFDSSAVDQLIKKYSGRLKAFKQQIIEDGERELEDYKNVVDKLILRLREDSVELTPETLAILQI